MNSQPESADGRTQLVPPLRKKTDSDVPYERRGEVEEELRALYAISIDEIAERSKISNANDPQCLSSEAVLHFVRRSTESDDRPYETLFRELRQRLLRGLPVRDKRLPEAKFAADRYQQEVRDQVVDKFMELLCIDRNEYSERLDFFEIMFNGAVARLRQTAKRDASERKKRVTTEPLPKVLEQPVDSDGFDESLQQLNEPAKNDENFYRFEVFSAISTLPDDERRVIELLIQGYLLKEVAGIVKCTEKTARERRNRASKKLAEVLEREDLE